MPRNGEHGRASTDRAERPESTRRTNLSTVLRTVLSRGTASRADVVRATGLSAPSLTNLVGLLVEARMIAERDPEPVTRGRPKVPLVVDGVHSVVRAVHVGQHAARVGIVGLDGELHREVVLPHHDTDPRAVVAAVVRALDDLVATLPPRARVLHTGVATGGTVDGPSGMVLDHPRLGWQKVPLAALLQERLGDERVVLDQAVRAAAAHELLFGYGRAADDFAVLHVSGAIGLALVQGGHVRAGATSAAGSVAHLLADGGTTGRICVCGRRGCLHTIAGDEAVVTRARSAGRDVTGIADVLALTAAGDELTASLLADRARGVARLAAVVIDLFDPGALILRGTVTAPPSDQLDVLRETVARFAYLPGAADRLVVADRSSQRMVPAAAAAAIQVVVEDPVPYL